MRSLALLTLLCFSLFTKADEAPKKLTPHEATYSAKITKGLNLNGSASRKLTSLPDGSWEYTFDVETLFATIQERSRFTLNGDQPSSTEYHYALSGRLIRDREQHIVFDSDKRTLTEHYRDKNWALTYPVDTLDRLNYQLKLQMDVALGLQEMDYQVIHKGKLRQYKFKVKGKELIETSLGKREAIIVEKIRESGKARETTLWFDTGSPYPLLRMIQTEENGDKYEINIETVK